jgi:catechol 2,3-dioxygenase
LRTQVKLANLFDMEAPTIAANPSGSRALLADDTRLGAVALTVSDLDRSIAYYTGVIGLGLRGRADGIACLGSASEDVVVLHERAGARRPGRESGIYHYALLFPTREELARVAMRVAVTRTPIEGASDHGTHEAIYLPDPDGIGIELAADRPRELWPDLSGFGEGPAPLDVRALLASVAGEDPSPAAAPGVRIGHVHLHVGDLEASTRFYRDGLGLELMLELPTAAFTSFGRYHHHLAYNLWRGRRATDAGEDAVGLRHWTLELARGADVDILRDRLERLGAPYEQTPDGLIARDPANIAVRVSEVS